MEEEDFEGSLVLEKLAEMGLIGSFFEAIDADDFDKVRILLKKAGIDAETIKTILRKMTDADGKH